MKFKVSDHRERLKGADATAKTCNGFTSFLFHLSFGYYHDNLIDIARLLMGNGVDINAKTAFDDEWAGKTTLSLLFLCGTMIIKK